MKAHSTKNRMVAGALIDFVEWVSSPASNSVTIGPGTSTQTAVSALRAFTLKRGLSLENADVVEWNRDDGHEPPGEKEKCLSKELEHVLARKKELEDQIDRLAKCILEDLSPSGPTGNRGAVDEAIHRLRQHSAKLVMSIDTERVRGGLPRFVQPETL